MKILLAVFTFLLPQVSAMAASCDVGQCEYVSSEQNSPNCRSGTTNRPKHLFRVLVNGKQELVNGCNEADCERFRAYTLKKLGCTGGPKSASDSFLSEAGFRPVLGFACADPSSPREDIGDFQVYENLEQHGDDEIFYYQARLFKQAAGGAFGPTGYQRYYPNHVVAFATAKKDCRERGGLIRYANGEIEKN